MSELLDIANNVVEAARHLPNDVEHPIAAGGSLVVAAVATVLHRRKYDQTEDTSGIPISNENTLKKSVLPEDGTNRRIRTRSSFMEYAGIGLVAATFAGGITHNTDKVDKNARVMVVQDKSNSMLLTKDLGKDSRDDVVSSAIKGTDYQGKLGVIQFAANSQTTVPLSFDWRNNVMKTSAKIDKNGGLLVPAMDRAETQLPLKTQPNGENNPEAREGSVVVITDGTVDDSPEAIAKQAKEIKKDGVDLKIIVTGTDSGSYKLRSSFPATSSKIKPELFAGVDKKDVIKAEDEKSATEAIQHELSDAGKVHHKTPWNIVPVVGGLLFAAGFVKDKLQRAKRVI